MLNFETALREFEKFLREFNCYYRFFAYIKPNELSMTPELWVSDSFNWVKTDEGKEFWSEINKEWVKRCSDILDYTVKVNIEYTVSKDITINLHGIVDVESEVKRIVYEQVKDNAGDIKITIKN